MYQMIFQLIPIVRDTCIFGIQLNLWQIVVYQRIFCIQGLGNRVKKILSTTTNLRYPLIIAYIYPSRAIILDPFQICPIFIQYKNTW